MQPKSEILKPTEGSTVGVGLHRILGVAWAGPDAVEAVEVSTDGGRTWAQAELAGISAPYSWTMWEYSWRPTQPEGCVLLSRAVATSGRVQPMRHDPLCGGYLIHHSRPVNVRVEPSWIAGDEMHREEVRQAFDQAAEDRSQMQLDVEMKFTDGGGI